MRSWGNRFGWLCLAVLVLARGASGQDVKPTVAPAPLELRRKPASIKPDELEKLLAEYERLVRAAGARVPTPSEMKAASEQLKRQDFSSSDEALAQLAQKAQTLYGLYLQIDYPVTGTIVGVGKVVRADGKRMGEEVRLERSREMRSYAQGTVETVGAVLEKLALGRLPSSLPVVAEPAKVDEPVKVSEPVKVERPIEAPPPPAAVVVSPGPSKGRLAAYVVGGAGLLASAIGTGMLVSASSEKGALGVEAGIVGVPYTAEAAARARGANSSSKIGGAMLGVGVGLLAAAVTVFVLFPGSDAPATVSFAPTAGGAFVGLTMGVP